MVFVFKKLALFLLVALEALAQSRTIPINVVIRDHSGAVPGLTAQDFTVTDKGRPVALTAVTRAFNSASAPSEPLVAGLYSNRLDRPGALPANATAIVLDAANTGPVQWPRFRSDVIRALIDLPPGHSVALFELDSQLRTIWPLNGDPVRFRATLAHYAASDKSRDFPPEVDPGLAKWLRETSIHSCLTLRDCLDRTLPAVVSISNHLSTIPGRRNLVWIAGAFPFSPGHTGAEGVPELAQNDRHRYDGRIQRAFEALTRANIAVYSVSTSPSAVTQVQDNTRTAVLNAVPRTPPPVNFTVPRTNNPLNTLADDSGGRIFPGRDIRAAIRSAIEDEPLSYTLHLPEPALEPGYHPIKVQLNPAHSLSGVQLHASAGYAVFPPSSPQALAEDIRDLLENEPEAIGITLTAGVERLSPNSVRTVCLLNPANLAFLRQDSLLTVSLDVVYALKPKGKSYVMTHQLVPLRFTQEQFDQILKDGFTLTRMLDAPPGAADLRILVADRNSARLGSVTAVIPIAVIP